MQPLIGFVPACHSLNAQRNRSLSYIFPDFAGQLAALITLRRMKYIEKVLAAGVWIILLMAPLAAVAVPPVVSFVDNKYCKPLDNLLDRSNASACYNYWLARFEFGSSRAKALEHCNFYCNFNMRPNSAGLASCLQACQITTNNDQ
jgi:hypothetical protein